MGNQQPSLGYMIKHEWWSSVEDYLGTEDGRYNAKNRVYSVSRKSWHPSYELSEHAQTMSALHLACLHCAPAHIIRKLLNTIGPGATSKLAQPCGETPLHFAVRGALYARHKTGRKGYGAIRTLLQEQISAVKIRSSADWGARTPLHIALQKRAPCSLIAILINADRDAAHNMKTESGQTALDIISSQVFRPVWRRKVKSMLLANTRHDLGTEVSTPKAPVKVHPKSNGEDAKKGDSLCIMCWDGCADHALVPCGHVCLCKNCSKGKCIRGAPLHGRCPVCKTQVAQTMKIFAAGIPNT